MGLSYLNNYNMAQAWLTDFAIGGTVGGITKTLTAPIERVKLLIQTQDANPNIISGEVERYKGMGDCFRRVTAEQGFPAFWRGNGANVMRYFPQQAFNLSFKDTLKRMFPKYDPKTQFWGFFGVNLASAGLGAALPSASATPSISPEHVSLPMSVVKKRPSTVSSIASVRPLPTRDPLPSTMVSVPLLPVSLSTVVSSSVCSTPSWDSTPTRRIWDSWDSSPVSSPPRLPESPPVPSTTPSTPSVVASRWSPRSPWNRESTRVPSTVPRLSSRRKDLVDSTRVCSPISLEADLPLWSPSFTRKSRMVWLSD